MESCLILNAILSNTDLIVTHFYSYFLFYHDYATDAVRCLQNMYDMCIPPVCTQAQAEFSHVNIAHIAVETNTMRQQMG